MPDCGTHIKNHSSYRIHTWRVHCSGHRRVQCWIWKHDNNKLWINRSSVAAAAWTHQHKLGVLWTESSSSSTTAGHFYSFRKKAATSITTGQWNSPFHTGRVRMGTALILQKTKIRKKWIGIHSLQRICSKNEWDPPLFRPHPSTKFQKNWFSSFCAFLLTVRQTQMKT